jgi:hypothetical protein
MSMDLYTLDDDNRNAAVTRDHRTQSTLRPVNLRPVAIAPPAAASYAQPTYGQPTYGQSAYAQAAYAQPGYLPPGYAPPGYPPNGYPGPGYGRAWGQPWGWNGPNGPMVYGAPWGSSSNTGQNLASGLGALIEIGTSLVAAFQSLPVAPNSDESTVLANVTDYQRRLAEHAKGDERLRTIGSAGGKVVDLAVRLFSNPSSGPGGAFMAPRGWY